MSLIKLSVFLPYDVGEIMLLSVKVCLLVLIVHLHIFLDKV